MKTTLLINAILAILSTFSFHSNYAQSVINNEKIRVGNGLDASINTRGNMEQPFYKNAGSWHKLTYSSQALNAAFAVGGDGTSEWNLSGSILTDPLLANQVIDEPGFTFTSGSNGPGTGTIVSTGDITVDDRNLQVEKTYELLPDKSFIRIKVKITNQSTATAENVRIWIGTKDDWVGTTDSPMKERGNLVNGEFQILSDPAERASVVRVTTNNEGVLFYTDTEKANGIIQHCCSFFNITGQNPETAQISNSLDGSYGFYVRLNDLNESESDEFTWYYAAGEMEDLDDITNQISQNSSSIGEVTCSSATFNASSDQSGTGYYVVTSASAEAPTAEEIKAGIDYGNATVVNGGNTEVVGGHTQLFEFSGLSHSTDYSLNFVVEDFGSQFTNITRVDFTSGTPPDVTFNTTPATGCGSVGGGSAIANVTGGTPPYTYAWSSGETTAEITDKTAGEYTLNLTDNGGCPGVESSVTIEIDDQTPPTIIAQDIEVTLDENGNALIDVSMVDDGSHDDCTMAELSLSKTTFNCADLGDNEVLLTATDQSGNSGVGSCNVRIIDESAPSATFSAYTALYLDEEGYAAPDHEALLDELNDNCGVASVTFDVESFDCSDIGLIDIEATIADASGNTSVLAGQALIVDTVRPNFSLESIELESDMAGTATLTEEMLMPHASDACGIDEIILENDIFTCDESGSATNVTVVDIHGNAQIFALQVILTENVPPVLTAQGATVSLAEDGRLNLNAEMFNVEASDNCGDVEVTLSKTQITCADIGMFPLILTATDESGNESQYAVMVEVIDDLDPEISLESKVYLCVGTPLNYNDFVSVSDNCEATLTQIAGPVNGSQLEPGLYHLRFKADDTSGNTSFSGTLLEVLEYPEVDLGEDVTIAPGSLVGLTAGTDPELNYEWSTGQNTPYVEVYVTDNMNVSVAVSNIGGCTSYDDINISTSTATSTSDGEDGNSFSLYPNPATNQINLSFGLNGSLNGATIRITDMQGKVVGKEKVARLSNGETHSLNVNNLSQGLYLVTISNDEMRMTTKFSKQ